MTGVSAAAGCGSSRASAIPTRPTRRRTLTKREAELYRQAWREPESTLWRRSDAPRVARWAYLAARAETDPASWVFTQLNVLERQLVMTPLARAAKVDDRELAADVADLLTERKPLRVRTRGGRRRTASAPGAVACWPPSSRASSTSAPGDCIGRPCTANGRPRGNGARRNDPRRREPRPRRALRAPRAPRGRAPGSRRAWRRSRRPRSAPRKTFRPLSGQSR